MRGNFVTTVLLVLALLVVGGILWNEWERGPTLLEKKVKELEDKVSLLEKGIWQAVNSVTVKGGELEKEVSALKETDQMLLSKTQTANDLAHRANIEVGKVSKDGHVHRQQNIKVEFSPVPLMVTHREVRPARVQGERKKLIKKVKGQLKELSR